MIPLPTPPPIVKQNPYHPQSECCRICASVCSGRPGVSRLVGGSQVGGHGGVGVSGTRVILGRFPHTQRVRDNCDASSPAPFDKPLYLRPTFHTQRDF